jgi:Mannosyl-glycoprotein endo-beta-N-acetylglucosaminidase
MKTCCCHSKSYAVVENQVICTNEYCDNFLKPTRFLKSSLMKYMVAIICFGLFFFKPYEDYCFSENTGQLNKSVSTTSEQIPLNAENLKFEIKRQQIFCADEVYAQMQLESGRLSSFLSKRANNLLGMRFPFKRTTTAVGIFLPAQNKIIFGTQEELLKYRNENHYAVYANWQECVKDYKLWQKECFKLNDRYLSFLGTYYAEDADYIAKIKNFRD